MRRTRLIAWGLVGGIALVASALLARTGVVVTQDGNRFEGDVVENKDKGTVDITPANEKTVTVNRANVASITYADQIDQEVRLRLAKLDRGDIEGRLELARYAVDHRSYESARDVLEDARRIEPQNRSVNDLLDSVNQQIRAHGPTTAADTAVPATRPVVAATQESTTHPATADQGGGAKRMVTAEEINRIRALELGKNDTTVRVRIDPEAIRKYLAFSGMSVAEFNRLQPVQKAYLILDKGKRDMREGVHILNDPPPLLEFRRDVLRSVITGCASSKCHGGHSAGSFFLFPQTDNEAAAYTDFVILQKYSRVVGARQFQFIDRETPGQSLLLEYLLPPEFADQPHSTKGGYHGALHSRNDPHYKTIHNWISTRLPIPAPDYSFIDLSTAATTKPAAAAAAAPAGGATP